MILTQRKRCKAVAEKLLSEELADEPRARGVGHGTEAKNVLVPFLCRQAAAHSAFLSPAKYKSSSVTISSAGQATKKFRNQGPAAHPAESSHTSPVDPARA